MAVTYSVGLTGADGNTYGQQYLSKLLDIPDTAARAGSFASNAANGTQLLCKNPDGSQSWYVIDADRSTFANPILLKVGP